MCQTRGCCRGDRKFVCFNCRTTAKGLDMMSHGFRIMKATNKTQHPNCPRCRQPMENVGMGAVIPKRTNDKRWRSMEAWFKSKA